MMLTETVPSKFKLRQERLARLGSLPVEKPKLPKVKPPEPHAFDFAWETMWFHQLVFSKGKIETVNARTIQIETARVFGITTSDLLSHRKTINLVIPRQLAMYVTKVLTKYSFPEIGRRFGGRDHTTVIHACRKIESLIGLDDKITGAFYKIKGAFV